MKIRFILFDWGGTLGRSGKRRHFLNPSVSDKTRMKALQDDTIHTLECLSKAGIPMGIVSNTSYTHHQMTKGLREMGLLKYFTFAIYSSDHQQCSKPCRKIFITALRKVRQYLGRHVRPENILFVGDNFVADVLGAISVGMTAAYVVNGDEYKARVVKLTNNPNNIRILSKISDLCNHIIS